MKRGLWVIVFAVGVWLAADVAAPRLRDWWAAPRPGYCPICQRHEHGDSVVRIKAQRGRVIEVCCLSCALTYERQTSKPVTVVSVTDHESGKALDPDTATFVVGSDVSPCTHATEQMRLEEEALPVHWDRCLPSILAFASREAAEAFRTQNGGRLASLRQVRADVAASKASTD